VLEKIHHPRIGMQNGQPVGVGHCDRVEMKPFGGRGGDGPRRVLAGAGRRPITSPTGRPLRRIPWQPTSSIASAARTPIAHSWRVRRRPGARLGKAAIKGALERAKVKPEEVDEVILGQILSAAQGQNPARQAAVNSGNPSREDRVGHQPSSAVGPARRRLRLAGDPQCDASIMVVGGQESMSQAPHAAYMREGTKMGELKK